MTFRYTKYGFVNALWSLIPIFPIWTLFFGIFLAMGLEEILVNCEIAYTIVMWISIGIALTVLFVYLARIEQQELKSKSRNKWEFRLWSFVIYTLTSNAAFILIVEPHYACHGDGQTGLAYIYSAPFATLSCIVFGVFVDLSQKK